MQRFGTVILLAGLGFYMLAFALLGAIPWSLRASREATVVDIRGETVPVPDYTPLERRGRAVYIREICWQCHSQFVRPAGGDEPRYGPVSQPGEFAYDRPHLLGTRRLGPDLAREGGKRTDDWHLAHLWNPRDVVPESIMPRFTWLFRVDSAGVPIPTADAVALSAYLQRLGTAIGDWRPEEPAPVAMEFHPAAYESPALVRARGEALYARKCVGCHGAEGKNGRAALLLNPKPRDFTRGQYKCRTTPSGALPTDSDLFRTITRGIPGTSMPPWGHLAIADRWYLVQYIKGFSDLFAAMPPEQPLVIPAPIARTPETIREGRLIYALMKCWDCHGKSGRGDGPSAATLTDDWGEPIRPFDFTRPRSMKCGSSDADIFRTLSTGLNGTPMPAYSEALLYGRDSFPTFTAYTASFSPEEISELSAYIASLPTMEEIAASSPRDRDDLSDRRRWALAHYVTSLSEAPAVARR